MYKILQSLCVLVVWAFSHGSQSSNSMSVNCGKNQSCTSLNNPTLMLLVISRRNLLCSLDSEVQSILSMSTFEERASSHALRLCQLQQWIEESGLRILVCHSFFLFFLYKYSYLVFSHKLNHILLISLFMD